MCIWLRMGRSAMLILSDWLSRKRIIGKKCGWSHVATFFLEVGKMML